MIQAILAPNVRTHETETRRKMRAERRMSMYALYEEVARVGSGSYSVWTWV